MSIEEQRACLREFLAAQQRQWEQTEAWLREHFGRLQGELAGEKQLAAEVESLRVTCEQLREELAGRAAPARPPAVQPPSGGVLSWEAEKSRILASLEADDNQDQTAAAERPTLVEVVRATDRIVADKDREIADLQNLLATQSNNLGSLSVGAAALGELIDQDAVIRQERQALKRLQEECREKLSQTEIDISLERAQLARQRAELDELRRTLEAGGASHGRPSVEAMLTAKPVRGRWLARLGLKDEG
jgi:hypothetical protein